MSGELLIVRRHPQDWQTATFHFEDAHGFNWDRVSGGVSRAAARDMVCCYVDCTAMIAGELAHSCRHGPPPHRIKVMVIKKLNEPAVYEKAKRAADADRAAKRLQLAVAANYERHNVS